MRGKGKASYHGLSFYIIDTQSQSGGYRLVQHTFPFRKKHRIDNLGPKINSISIRATFLGDNYIAACTRFVEKIEKTAIGELVHPAFPRGQYYCEEYRPELNPPDQRIAWCDLTLIPVGEEISPEATTDTKATLLDAVNHALDEAINSFENLWAITDNIAGSIDSILAITDTLMYAVDGLMGGGRVFDLVESIKDIRRQANRLVNRPRALAESLTAVTLGIRRHSTASEASVLYNQLLGSIASRQHETTQAIASPIANYPVTVAAGGQRPFIPEVAHNHTALNTLVIVIAHCGSVLVWCAALQAEIDQLKQQHKPETPELEPQENPIIPVDADETPLVPPLINPPAVSRENIEETLWETVQTLEQLTVTLSIQGWDYLALMDVRLAFIREANLRSDRLTGTRPVWNQAVQPALTFLYETCQNAQNWALFCARERVRNPLFLSGQRTYEVPDDSATD